MSSLLEIADAARTVKVRDKDVAVWGISGHALAVLFTRFPEIGKIFAGGTPDRAALFKIAPKALSAIIAAGCGQVGNEKAEEIASKLGVGEQLDIMNEIFRLTFPRGVGPFVENLRAMGLLPEEVLAAPEQVANQPSPTSPPSQTSSSPQTTKTR